MTYKAADGTSRYFKLKRIYGYLFTEFFCQIFNFKHKCPPKKAKIFEYSISISLRKIKVNILYLQ